MQQDQINDRFGNPVPAWYHGYVKALKDRNYMDVLSENLISTPAFLNRIVPVKENFAYAHGKWTIKEVVLHFIDAERIFAYRAVSFARGEKANLPGFEENEYVPNSGAANRNLSSIVLEYKAVRNSTIELFKNLDETMLSRTGTANNYTFSTDLIGIIIAGHELHHMKVLKERYL